MLRHVVTLLALFEPLGCAAEPPAAPPITASEPTAGDLVPVPEAGWARAVPLPPATLAALRSGQWSAAADQLATLPIPAEGAAEIAFVRAYALVQADRGAEAVKLLPLVDQATTAPRGHVDLVRGEALRLSGKPAEALALLQSVPAGSLAWSRAQVALAATLQALARREEAMEVLRAAAERPDPALDGERVLLALARALPAEEAYPLLRRIWRAYPGTPSDRDAAQLLSAYPADAAHAVTWQDAARRGERLLARSDWDGALAATEPFIGQLTEPGSEAWCRFKLVRGRAFYKKNQLANTVTALADMGSRCVSAAPDAGARGLYIQGTAEFRRKQYASAAQKFTDLARAYPDHSMADDGYLHGGIALQEAGDLAGAQALWTEGRSRIPGGDTVPEASWRLAWSLYLAGRTADAIAAADALGALPLTADAGSVAAGRYWAARWRYFPNAADPRAPNADPAARAAAIDGWERLVRELPQTFYAIQAFSRLQQVAPERASAVGVRPADHDTGSEPVAWTVRQSFLDDPAIRDGVALARVGLIADAKVAWASAATPPEDRTADEVAWLFDLRIAADDWLFAHDEWRAWLKSHAIPGLGAHRARIVRLAYPDRYWTEVRAAVPSTYLFPARLFHALSREESNFNASIVSHAGAVGLSQLMPATAAQTAGWLGIRVTTAQLDDPALNAKIGARYLDAMVKQHGGSPYLALAAYNAGAGRTREWRTAWGDVPTDEFVERIPFRETRDYVKRVMGTWQVYRWQFDTTDPAYPDLSAFADHAWPRFGS